MTYPKAPCPVCGRPTALLPTRRAGYGSVHDHKVHPRELVLCGGSMQQMPLAQATAWQLEFQGEQAVATDPSEAMTLF